MRMMRRMSFIIAATGCWAALAGCEQVPDCHRIGGVPMLEYQLYFGRASVTDRQWADFTAEVVTPNLPDGFTAFDADGQWMNPETHQISQDRTKVIFAAVIDTTMTRTAIARIKDEYRQRFHQISVGTAIHPVCGAF